MILQTQTILQKQTKSDTNDITILQTQMILQKQTKSDTNDITKEIRHK